jgi:hypothetical protein
MALTRRRPDNYATAADISLILNQPAPVAAAITG